MGYPVTVQAIERKKQKQAQWYVNFPNALAQALNLKKGETVEWELDSLQILKLVRVEYAEKSKKKTKKTTP